MAAVLSTLGSAIYYGLDAAAKLTKDIDATSQAARTCSIFLKYVNLNVGNEEAVLYPVVNTISVIVEFSIARSWISNAKMLLTGEAAGEQEHERISIDDDISIPNFLRIASTCCFLVSDILGTIKWLDSIELLNLAKISASLGDIPVFGAHLMSFTLEGVRNTFGLVGCIIDIADAARDIMQNGLTWYNAIQVAGDVARIVGIMLIGATGQFIVIALVANGTSSICFLTRFIMKNYKVGGAI